ncbi:MAG TPA: DCC1-like thiol-disulfide oxidoreductase family protein, partial [Chitinophagaceae bacterium]|nr:DCC1-like thiol-disulfide oxidoreductase family protein [Chitinophagaceae bacterium]
MKTLSNHSLLFDQDCPLCHWYTGIFLKYKLLDAKGRIPFQEIDASNFPTVDYDLAKNKIALLNRENGEVVYGIDGLVKILGNNFGLVRFFIQFKIIRWFLEQLYNLISFNRKIVIPVSCTQSGSCNPSHNWFWRIAFIFICGLTVNLFVNSYFHHQLSAYYIGNPIWGDSVLFFGQILFQIGACYLLKEKNIYDYIGHVSFISFLGAILLGGFNIGLQLFDYYHIQIQMLQPLCYGIVFAWMFIEHRRRLAIADMNKWLTLT